MSLDLSILQKLFTSSGKVTETSILPLATNLSEIQAEWPRFSLPYVFPVTIVPPSSPTLCVPLEILFICATASFCRLAPSLMFTICFCILFFLMFCVFLGRVAVLVIREVSRLLRLEDFEEILQLFARGDLVQSTVAIACVKK